MKTFEQYNQKEKRILVYRSYLPDENDRIVEITEDEYETLPPFNDQLSMGNDPGGLEDMIWNDIYQRSIEILKKDIPLEYDIEVAIC